MAGRPYILAETNWKSVRDTRYDVAILPWGATEAHNYHLPYGTDVIETDAVAAESAAVKLPCSKMSAMIGVASASRPIVAGTLSISISPIADATVLRIPT